MTACQILASYLYNARPIVYRPWPIALEPARRHYELEAKQVIALLKAAGYIIVPADTIPGSGRHADQN